jgi:hypothetical protein
MYKLHNMHPSNPRDERRHYPIILHGLKHIGVMETPENVVDEDGSDEAWEHILGTPLSQRLGVLLLLPSLRRR